ncbi:MAG: AAA family ATPase [Bacteroidota bacterium]
MQDQQYLKWFNTFQDQNKVLKSELSKVIIGQDDIISNVLISIFSKGHCLLVGVPGLAKTLLVQTLAKALGLQFNRIQFTPDVMPADITGSEIFNAQREFEFIKGPLFAQVVLADEINRTPPKTQSALLEAMQERQVTALGKKYKLPDPFFVLATQNPIEQEGTSPLPEAQLDRFMFQLNLDYPSFEEEFKIINGTTGNIQQEVSAVLDAQQILNFQELVRAIPVPENVIHYAIKLVQKTRIRTSAADPLAIKYLEWGAGPRASQNLILGAKCHALMHGKFSPDIEDIIAVAKPVMRHRIIINYKAESEGFTTDRLIEEWTR